jgi:hypothetical protein
MGRREWRFGLAAGVVPQALLLVYLLSRLMVFRDDADERAYLVLLLFANVTIIPLCYVAAGLCFLLGGAIRNFGVGLFVGSTVAAGVFSAICLAATVP